ncbi:actin family [Cokeromyces recurvatus]|uniref:actin family n=1 Tax=Cokeromyces recurvatus TaxID=90255 RepID=UPI00221EC7AC|nr:actin family [Cokeromyces recurvatus]KAI7906029.1 actin family [Cokeromyces recurvatus]
MVAYGGDEVNALVFDMGSSMTRAGYAGEDTPRVMFPTSVGYIDIKQEEHSTVQPTDEDSVMTDADKPSLPTNERKYFIGDNKINVFRSQMEIKNPLKDGIVEDWEAVEQIWDFTFNNMLRIKPEEHPLLCTEPAWNTKENREKTIEIAFEKFQFPAFYLAVDAVLTAFSVGRATALVLDSGGEVTSTVPVYDGFVLKKGVLHQPIAGNTLTEMIKTQLKNDLNYTITPRYKIAKMKKQTLEAGEQPEFELRELEGLNDSFNEYQINRVINEYKETVCQVSEVQYDEVLLSSRPKKSFGFPDGFNYSFGLERYKVPELLFDPNMNDKSTETQEEEEEKEGKEKETTEKKKYLGAHEMVYNSINNCDIDLRPLLFNNVVVTGGNTLFNGFNERLNYELPLKAPGSKIKIHAAGNATERKSSSWLGGSILASLGTFHQLWISRSEYDEFGASIVHRKC